MRIIKKTIITLIVCMLGILNMLAEKAPPSPPPTNRVVASSVPPPPPGLPINENIFILIIIALLLGIYIIYNHRLKTKTPI